MKTSFDHEELDVYKAAIKFVNWVGERLVPCFLGSSEASPRAEFTKNQEDTERQSRRIDLEREPVPKSTHNKIDYEHDYD